MSKTKINPKIDEYAKRYITMLKAARTDVELANIVNKIYEQGFEDGANAD